MRFFFFWRNWMHEQLSIKALPWFLKIIAAVSVAISLYGGSAFIEYYDLAGHYSHMAQGFVMLMFAVFGMLCIGILYQAVQLMKGKSLTEIIVEIKETFGS